MCWRGLYARAGDQERVDKKTPRSRAFSPMCCHGAARIVLTAPRSYDAVALHRGSCEKLLRDGKLATSSYPFLRAPAAQVWLLDPRSVLPGTPNRSRWAGWLTPLPGRLYPRPN